MRCIGGDGGVVMDEEEEECMPTSVFCNALPPYSLHPTATRQRYRATARAPEIVSPLKEQNHGY